MDTIDRSVTKEALFEHLSDWDPRSRHQARQALVNMGEDVLPQLLEKLSDHNWHVRWEAVKALGEIGNPAAAEHMVKLLQDDDTSVRWAAMGSLIELGRAAVEPVLLVLTREFQSARLRQGAHHILHIFHARGLLNHLEAEVYHALEGPMPGIEAARAANRAIIKQ